MGVQYSAKCPHCGSEFPIAFPRVGTIAKKNKEKKESKLIKEITGTFQAIVKLGIIVGIGYIAYLIFSSPN